MRTRRRATAVAGTVDCAREAGVASWTWRTDVGVPDPPEIAAGASRPGRRRRRGLYWGPRRRRHGGGGGPGWVGQAGRCRTPSANDWSRHPHRSGDSGLHLCPPTGPWRTRRARALHAGGRAPLARRPLARRAGESPPGIALNALARRLAAGGDSGVASLLAAGLWTRPVIGHRARRLESRVVTKHLATRLRPRLAAMHLAARPSRLAPSSRARLCVSGPASLPRTWLRVSNQSSAPGSLGSQPRPASSSEHLATRPPDPPSRSVRGCGVQNSCLDAFIQTGWRRARHAPQSAKQAAARRAARRAPGAVALLIAEAHSRAPQARESGDHPRGGGRAPPARHSRQGWRSSTTRWREPRLGSFRIRHRKACLGCACRRDVPDRGSTGHVARSDRMGIAARGFCDARRRGGELRGRRWRGNRAPFRGRGWGFDRGCGS